MFLYYLPFVYEHLSTKRSFYKKTPEGYMVVLCAYKWLCHLFNGLVIIISVRLCVSIYQILHSHSHVSEKGGMYHGRI